MKAASSANLPGIVFAQGPPYFRSTGFASEVKRHWFRRAVRDHATRIVCVAPAIRTILIRDFGVAAAKCLVIQNGLDTGSFEGRDPAERSAVRKEFEVGEHQLLAVNIGSLYAVKGQDLLVRAVAQLRRSASVPPFRVLLVGDTRDEAYRRNLCRLIDSLGVFDWVQLTGSRVDCPRLLQGADLFVLSSRSEGLPLVVLEAFASRCPVLMTEYGERFEGFGDGVHGRYVPTENVQALADGLEEFLRMSPERRAQIGQNGKDYLDDHFSLDVAKQRFVAEVEQVIADGKRAAERSRPYVRAAAGIDDRDPVPAGDPS